MSTITPAKMKAFLVSDASAMIPATKGAKVPKKLAPYMIETTVARDSPSETSIAAAINML